MNQSIESKRSYSNIEIVNLVILSLAYGCPEAVKDMEGGTIIMRSWKALDETFEKAYKQGRERGYQEGYSAFEAKLQKENEICQMMHIDPIEDSVIDRKDNKNAPRLSIGEVV